MTEKFINVGIFWLPLIAGIILGGLGPSVWYGGDKLAALWMGFAGLAFLLLTATFQIQAYIQSTILQPQFEVSPQQKSVLTWNPPTDNSLGIRGVNDQLPAGGWKVPTFVVKNATTVSALDVKIKWSALKYDPNTLTATAPIFQGHQVQIANDRITLYGGGVPYTHPFSFSATVEKPFITKTGEIFIPIDVWETAALYFVSTMPSQNGATSEPYYFDLEISWSIPDNAKPAKYRVKAIATNTVNAHAMAYSAVVEFSVESTN